MRQSAVLTASSAARISGAAAIRRAVCSASDKSDTRQMIANPPLPLLVWRLVTTSNPE